MKINDIVIVGGGSAGWMTAAILLKDFPEKNITLIESPTVPTVGVGESTYDGINYFFEYLEIDKNDFFSYTNASIKLGVKFVNFYENDGTSFLYPFGKADISETFYGMQDWMIRKYLDKNLPVTDFAESYFPVAHLINHNTFNDNSENVFANFIPEIHTALHFDAIKFAEWLKEKYCLPKGINHIVSNVKDIIVQEDGIKYLVIDDNRKIFSDLFVDCTGFKSLLLSEAMKEPFIEKNDVLPNNRAWATQIPYTNKEKELTSVTKCTALSNGWCWNTPLYSRLGAGYVYSDKYISPKNALEEFKNYLSSTMMDVPKNKELINSLKYQDIKMRVGIHERIWVKNVVAIGLSAGFIEPLEGNGLFTTHEFLFNLVRALKRKKTTSWDIEVFNESSRTLYDAFLEFIRLHYALSIRDDSNYWKDNSFRNYDFIKNSKQKVSEYMKYLYQAKTENYIPDHTGGFPTGVAMISTGMNYFILDDISSRIGEINQKRKYSDIMENWFKNIDEKKYYWDTIAKKSPSMNQYLTQRYHSNEK